MNKCKYCGRDYQYNNRKGHTLTYCNSCSINKRRIIFKLRAIRYKGGACQRCGYSKCFGSLVFHHLDPQEKEFTISSAYHKSWDLIVKELDKCELICSNCHGEIHYALLPEDYETILVADPDHGTYGRYLLGCRCEECNLAQLSKIERYKNTVNSKPMKHGTVHCYTKYSCRCDPCKEANYSQVKRFRLRQKLKITGLSQR